MTTEKIGACRVGGLLISASYGIGFLFGSGELAVRTGMAGSLYAIATATGMAILALCARRLWIIGLPIWDSLGNAYGIHVKHSVALLSLIWMAGVLAAQIQGGLAVMTLIGLPGAAGFALLIILIVTASSMRLSTLSVCFTCCLIASNFLLLYAIASVGRLDIYWHALPLFVHDARHLPIFDLLTTAVAVCFLVITGADYQQFVIAARRSIDARRGCFLAALFLLITGFLPASAVIATRSDYSNLSDAKQIIPIILENTVRSAGHEAKIMTLIVLICAALGAGAAITRAMTSAVASCIVIRPRYRQGVPCLIIMGSSIVAARGQGIVQTIVGLNIVFIAAIGVLFVLHTLGIMVSPKRARWMMGLGFATSLAIYLIDWMKIIEIPTYISLLGGLLVSLAIALPEKITKRHDVLSEQEEDPMPLHEASQHHELH